MTGLEALKEFKGNNNTILVGRVMGKQHYLDCLQAIEKSLKALEIIKEKYPDVVEVKLCNNYEHYKLRMSSKHDTEIVKIDWNDKSLVDYLKLLTEEEFNLLKEMLE